MSKDVSFRNNVSFHLKKELICGDCKKMPKNVSLYPKIA